jgi:hypothetical protein
MSGSPPPSSTKRREKDTMRPASSAFRKNYSPALLRAVDWAMEVDPLLRPQSVDQLLEVIDEIEVGEDKRA